MYEVVHESAKSNPVAAPVLVGRSLAKNSFTVSTVYGSNPAMPRPNTNPEWQHTSGSIIVRKAFGKFTVN